MTIVFLILVVLICVILGLIILVQNPKGGGLAANIGGISNQFMGVKQTTDVLEKGTWIFAALIGILCIISPVFIPAGSSGKSLLDNVNTKAQQTAPAAAPVTPAPAPATTPVK